MVKPVQNIAKVLERFISNWTPNSFVFTILITVLAFAMSVGMTTSTLSEVIMYWGDGLWSLLSFAMQIVLILITGFAIASSKPAMAFFSFIANKIKTTRQAVGMVTLVSMICSWLNPGFGLIAGAIFATAVGRRIENANFPLLIASSYSGHVIWHAGISGTIPLKIASPDNDALGNLLPDPIPLSETVFSTPNIILCIILLVSLPLLNMWMDKGSRSDIQAIPIKDRAEIDTKVNQDRPVSILENSKFLALIVVGFGVLYLLTYFSSGKSLSLNTINLIFLLLGLFLHGSPIAYANAIAEGTQSVSGVILQYPFYGGIMGMMSSSGLTSIISGWFVSISTPSTYLLYTFLGAGVLNYFIPSGGGQWAVQAPIVVESASEAGIPLAHAAMAVAYGDTWSNLIQPFWTLPILAVSGLSIKHIMSYCLVTFVWTGLVFSFVLLVLY